VRKILTEPPDTAPRCPDCGAALVLRSMPEADRKAAGAEAGWRCGFCRVWFAEDPKPEAPGAPRQGALDLGSSRPAGGPETP
jgi:tRNA(Ile2) C34 agmatinyltransferase TiaS